MKSCIRRLRRGDTIHARDEDDGELVFFLAESPVHEDDSAFTVMAKKAPPRSTGTAVNYLFFHEEITRIEKGRAKK